MNPNTAIGIDLGGTRIKGVLLQRDGTILHQLVRDTQDSHDAQDLSWRKEVKSMAEELLALAPEGTPLGLSAPGLPDAEHRWIEFMPGRLEGLELWDWAQFIGLDRAMVLNDAKAAMLAEYHFGAAQGYQDVMLLTLGTGVGGAMISDGKLIKGWLNRAGHLGHLSQQPFGPDGIFNLPGTLEMNVGNAYIKERSRGRFANTKGLVEAYRRGETYGTLLWLDTLRSLAMGISSFVNALSPELVLLSGGMTKADDALFGPLADLMALYEWRPGGQATTIRKAKFEAFAGAVGSACFVMFEDQ
jgi:glucokinase